MINKPSQKYISSLIYELDNLELSASTVQEQPLNEWIVMEFGSRWMDLNIDELEETD